MSAPVPSVFDLSGRAQAVVDHHYDPSRPGKPLWLLIPGGLVALLSLVAALAVWGGIQEGDIGQTGAVVSFTGLFVTFVGGTFAFSYGYELYDLRKAMRLTLIIVVLIVLAVLIAAVLVMAVQASGRSRSRSRSSPAVGLVKPMAGLFMREARSGFASPSMSGGSGGFAPHAAPVPVPAAAPVAMAPVAVKAGVPMVCASCGKTFTPIAGRPPMCPYCGAGSALPPAE